MRHVAAFLSVAPLMMAACTSPPVAQTVAHDPAQCPDLTGVYEDVGTLSDISMRGIAPLKYYFTFFLASGLEPQPDKRHLFTVKRGTPMQFHARAVRVGHATAGTFFIEPLDAEGKSMGSWTYGPERGWRCAGGAFVSTHAARHGGADFTPRVDIRSVQRITRGADGAFVLNTFRSTQDLAYLLNFRTGDPAVSGDEMRFPPRR